MAVAAPQVQNAVRAAGLQARRGNLLQQGAALVALLPPEQPRLTEKRYVIFSKNFARCLVVAVVQWLAQVLGAAQSGGIVLADFLGFLRLAQVGRRLFDIGFGAFRFVSAKYQLPDRKSVV